MKIIKTYKLRLYPNKLQEQKLLQILGCCRYVYNFFLEKKQNYYKESGKNLSSKQICKELTKMRSNIDWLGKTQIRPLQHAVRRLDIAYDRFFKKISKYPRFKNKKDINQSFSKPRDYVIKGNKIQIQKGLSIRFRGKISETNKLGTLVVSHQASGKWYATITAKIEHKTPKRYTKPVGIDLGITSLITLSTGRKYANLKPQENLQARLTKAQKVLAKKQKDSKRREKARQGVARVYEKIRNVRENHLHQVSHDIVSKNHAMIAVEDLNVRGMMQNKNLSRSLIDASFGELLRQIKYKQEWNGGKIVEVGRFYPSSKTCSFCQFVVETLPLEVRTWQCEKCGTKHDRDINAAKNILAEAVRHTERGEVERVSVRKESPTSVKRGYAIA